MITSTSNPMRATREQALLLILAASCVFGCAPRPIAVPTGPHRVDKEGAVVPVAVPPPSAKLEVVPLHRNPACLYLDGHYHPAGGGWVWTRGAWVLVPKDCYYAPPATHYEKIEGGTTLVFRPGFWHKRGSKSGKCGKVAACPNLDTNVP